MFNIGFPEFAIIFMAALLLLGPKKLPEFARWVGRAMREFRDATQDIRSAIDMELEREEFERLQEEFKSSVDPSLFDPAQVDGQPSEYAYSVPDEEDEEDENFDVFDHHDNPDEATEQPSSEDTAEDADTASSSEDDLPEISGPPPGTVSYAGPVSDSSALERELSPDAPDTTQQAASQPDDEAAASTNTDAAPSDPPPNNDDPHLDT